MQIPKALVDALLCLSGEKTKKKVVGLMSSIIANALFDMCRRDDKVRDKILPMLSAYYNEIAADSMTEYVGDYVQGPGIYIGSNSERTEDSDGEGDSGDTEGTVSGSA